MFGIKIIKESEYNELKSCAQRHYDAHKKEREQIESVKKDCESLRQQLNKKIKEVKILQKFKDDTFKTLSEIDLGDFRICACNSKCDFCEHESDDCRKYSIGDQSFCVLRRQ